MRYGFTVWLTIESYYISGASLIQTYYKHNNYSLVKDRYLLAGTKQRKMPKIVMARLDQLWFYLIVAGFLSALIFIYPYHALKEKVLRH